LHDLLDADGLAVDVLHVQPSSDDLTVTDLEKRYPSHLEGLAVAPGTGPVPFAPRRVTVRNRPTEFSLEVRDPGKHGLPVGSHLSSPDEGEARVRRLFAAVVLVHQARSAIKIVLVHGNNHLVDHVSHRTLPWFVGSGALALVIVVVVVRGRQARRRTALVHRRHCWKFSISDPVAPPAVAAIVTAFGVALLLLDSRRA
jgi:hypothetical protein